MDRIIDPTFGISSQALAVMNFMRDMEPDFAEYKDGYYKATFETKPWYNGRERGFMLSMTRDYKKWAHIAVYEHRNTDSICALSWQTNRAYFNHPLEDPEIWKQAFPGDNSTPLHSVGYGEVGAMARWVYKELEKIYRKWWDSDTDKQALTRAGGER